MRYTPTLKLSTRLVAFVTMTVISAMFILFLGGTLSFQRLGQEYLNHYLQGIVEVVDKEMEDPDAAYSMQRWMPKCFKRVASLKCSLLPKRAPSTVLKTPPTPLKLHVCIKSLYRSNVIPVM